MGLSPASVAVGLPVDGRGLVDLRVAREQVQKANEFRRGAVHVRGPVIHDSDVLWACLMSLQDASEFLREAGRLSWYFHPRQFQNLDPFERYGEGILPWLLSFVRSGSLVNVPWCVTACLLEFGTAEVWEVLRSIEHVIVDDLPGPGPFAADELGDTDARGFVAEPSERSASAAVELQMAFAVRYPAIAVPEILLSAGTDPAALDLVRCLLVSQGPSWLFERASAAFGEEKARDLLGALSVPTSLTVATILAVLDLSASRPDSWPRFYGRDGRDAYHALRLLAYRQVDGDGWAVLFERLEGDRPGTFVVARLATSLAFGCGQLPAGHNVEVFLDGGWRLDGSATLVGPAGDVEIERAELEQLEPERGTGRDQLHMDYTLLVRRYLALDPHCFWTERASLHEKVGLRGYRLVVDSDAFEHVVGTASAELDPEGIDARWRKLPSESLVYQSLARALVARDPSLFEPGESNLSWRLHLDAPKASRRLG